MKTLGQKLTDELDVILDEIERVLNERLKSSPKIKEKIIPMVMKDITEEIKGAMLAMCVMRVLEEGVEDGKNDQKTD